MKTIRGALGIDPGRVKRNPNAQATVGYMQNPSGAGSAQPTAEPGFSQSVGERYIQNGFRPQPQSAGGGGNLGQQHRAQQIRQNMLSGPPPAKGSGQLGQYNRAMQIQQQQMMAQPHPTGGPMYAPQGQPGVGIGNYMQNQVGAFNQPNPYAQQMAQMQGQMYTNAAAQAPQSVGDMTAQQRNPNYIQGR